MTKPKPDEYPEFYATYVDKVPEGPIAETLANAPAALEGLLSEVPESREDWAYAPGKWTIREVLGHMIDTERLFSYRALHMARSDQTPLPGMDENEWAAASNANGRSLADLKAEFHGLRAANVAFFSSLDDEVASRTGVANEAQFTVRALAYIVAGHEIHHRGVLAERYVAALETEVGADD